MHIMLRIQLFTIISSTLFSGRPRPEWNGVLGAVIGPQGEFSDGTAAPKYYYHYYYLYDDDDDDDDYYHYYYYYYK